jgi:glutamate formiminotransferase
MLLENLASKVDDQKVLDVQIEADFWRIVAIYHGDKQKVKAALGFIRKKRSELAKRLSKDYKDSLKNNIGQEDESL